MFNTNDTFNIITIDSKYIETLHNACSEVYYSLEHYENKPYLGILISSNKFQYCIHFTSAKLKHKLFSNYKDGRLLIYEIIQPSSIMEDAILVENADGTYKHILALLIISKMIPIKEGVYKRININIENNDSKSLSKYKALLTKELRFCISRKHKIIKIANKIYDRQIKTGIVHKNYVNFSILEKECEKY